MGIEQVAECAKVAEAVDARVVTIAPTEAEGIVANLFQAAELEVAALLKLDDARMPLAAGTGTIATQNFVRELGAMAVGPADFELSGAVGGLDPGGLVSRQIGHLGAADLAETGGISLQSARRSAISPVPVANPSESVQCKPLEVQVGDKGIERAIKHLKRKMAGEGILRELKRRRHYMKPSVKRRKKMSEAARRRRKRLKTDDLPRTMA